MENSNFNSENEIRNDIGKENISDKQKNDKNKNSIKKWIIGLTFLYFVSVICAFILISKTGNRLKVVKLEEDKVISSSLYKKDAIAVIPIYGVIYQDMGSSFVERGSRLIASKIRKMAKDKKVKGIVLDINSPGGSVGAVQEIYSTILKMKAETKKPFIAHFGEVAASGGYYIASACDKIISHSGTITGSIGVIFSVGNVEGLFKKIGIKSEVIKSGKYKDIGSITREMTKEEREILQSMIDDSYNSFLEAVSQGRKIPREKLREIADGRVFTGNQALKVGLVDKIGDFQDALDEAGIMAGLGKSPRIIKTRSYSLDDILEILDSRLSFLKNMVDLRDNFPRLEYRWTGF